MVTELPTILIYHSNKILLQRLVQFVQAAGYATLGTSSESETLDLVREMKPQVVLIAALLASDLSILDDARAEYPAARLVVLVETDTMLERTQAAAADEVVLYDEKDIGNVLESLGRFASAPKPPESFENVGVLIVDDEPDTVDMLTEYLTQRGYPAFGALSGTEAMDILKHNPEIRVVLLDIKLPDIGGVEVLRAITGTRAAPAVIMLTAVRDSEIARRAMQIGALDYLVKPIDLKALDESITVALARREYRTSHWWNRLQV